MTPETLARIHAASFTDAPRPWTAEEFTAVLTSAGVFLCTRDQGFALGRVAGPEAELLTLAVDPGARGAGIGRALVEDFEGMASAKGAQECFLEVAETNTTARRLYERCGYAHAGARDGYYRTATGRITAIVMHRGLPTPR